MSLKLGYLWVGLGGAIGAMARVLLSSFLPESVLTLPTKILLINVLGCFVAGALVEVWAFYGSPSIQMRHFLVQGLLGGFTTFSAFAIEFGLLYRRGSYLLGAIYALASVILSLLFFFLGLKLVRLFS